MGSNSNVNRSHFTSAELIVDELRIFFTKETTITRNKIVSDSPNNRRNITMNVDIMFNGKCSRRFAKLLWLRSGR